MTKSPSIAVKTLLVLAVAGSMAAFFVQPAAAQTATGLKCKGCLTSKQVKNGKLKGKDLKDSTVTGSKIAPNAVDGSKIAPNAVDGSKIADGAVGTADLGGDSVTSVKILDGTVGSSDLASSVTVGGGVTLDGPTGNVTNLFANVAGSSNGLVKAWAKMNSDGTIDSCYLCDTDPGETFRNGLGFYTVDFTPLGTDIRARPRFLALDSHSGGPPAGDQIKMDDSSDVSSVNVTVGDPAGANEDSDFTIIIF